MEGPTDLNILREWARALNHRLYAEFFQKALFWHPNGGGDGAEAQSHFDALLAAKLDMRGVLLVDTTARQTPSADPPQAGKLYRLKWSRYEIESYLIHAATLRRFVEQALGPGDLTAQVVQTGMDYLEAQMGPPFMRDPLAETAVLRSEAVSKTVLPSFLQACGIHDMDKSDYYKIAAVQQPDELPPEVSEKLDLIAKALDVL